MIFMAELTFGSNFFIGGESTELHPFSTVSQVISTSVNNLWPLCFTIAGRCWPGALRLTSQIASSRREISMPEIGGKLTFRPNLCYFIFPWEELASRRGPFRGFSPDKQAQKPSLDCSGPGCCIIFSLTSISQLWNKGNDWKKVTPARMGGKILVCFNSRVACIEVARLFVSPTLSGSRMKGLPSFVLRRYR